VLRARRLLGAYASDETAFSSHLVSRITGQVEIAGRTSPVSAFTRLVQLLEGIPSMIRDNFTGKGFVFGPYINFLHRFIGIAAAMNTVRVKGEFNA